MQYELIDQTGQQYGRNRQWVVATLGAKKRAFCVVPAWEDYPAEQVKADAEQVLNALNERDALRDQVAELRGDSRTLNHLLQVARDVLNCASISDVFVKVQILEEQNVALVAALKDARRQLEEYEIEVSGEVYNDPDLNALIAAAERKEGE